MQKLFAVELVFVLILFSLSADSLKCFVCRSDTDDGCSGSNISLSLSQECPRKENKPVYCRKISQRLRFKNEEKWTSIRECAYEKGKKDCYIFKWIELAYQETCECSHDNCNRGYSSNPSVLTLTVTISIWIINYLMTDET